MYTERVSMERTLASQQPGVVYEAPSLELTVLRPGHTHSLLTAFVSRNMEEPQFFGFGAFETTAFVSAVLVALYTFIPDPTGRQDAEDVSEHRVYSGWFRGLLIILIDVAFQLAVLIVQVRASLPAETVAWVFFLMLAPWAPLADKVAQNLRARTWSTVRDMMRGRVPRNETAVVLREFLRTGHPGLFTLEAARHARVARGLKASHSFVVQRALTHVQTNNADSKWISDLVDHLKYHSCAKGELDGGVILSDKWLDSLSLWTHYLDPLAWCWTRERRPWIGPRVTPFEVCRGRPRGDPHEQSHFISHRTRALILDTIDKHVVSGTMTHVSLSRMRSQGVCVRCCVALRAAVESFLESSDRQHADVRADTWLKGVEFTFSGRINVVVRAMRESVFRDHPTALDVPPGSLASDYKHASRNILLLFFLVARCLFDRCAALEGAYERVKKRFQTEEWWVDFWKMYIQQLQEDALSLTDKRNLSPADWEKCDKVVVRVMHLMVDREVRALLECFEKGLPNCDDAAEEDDPRLRRRFCNEELCMLSKESSIAVTISAV